MNKLFKKIAGLAFGFSLAIAGGSAAIIHSSRGFDVAKADGTAISVSDLVDGDRCFITANNYVLKASTFTAKKSGNSTEAYDGNGLSEASAWLFTQVDTNGDGTKDSWTISYNNGKSYLYVTKDNNGLVSGTPSASATNNKYWTITATGEGTTAYLVANDGTNNRYLALYGNTNFRCYTSTSNGTPQIQLYRYVAPSKTVTSLEITNNPTKMTYEEGEKLDLTGLVVTANWSDGTKTDCTAEAIYSISSGTVLSASDAKITITYGGKSVILTITVSGLKYSTEDLYLTAEALGLTASYGTTDIVYSIGGLDFKFGRTDVMKGTNFGDSIQFKASTGKLYNKSQFSAKLSKIYLLADADNDNAPSNYAVYAPTTMGGTDNALEIVTEDATNRVYSVDFSGGEYYNFTLAKTGRYAMYFDQIVIELDHSGDDVAAVRTAASSMLTTFASFCSGHKGPTTAQWEEIGGYYTALTTAQKAIFDKAVLNTAPCNSGHADGAPVQGTDLQKVVQKIEYCVSTYGLTNFTGRTISPSHSINRYVPTVNTTTIIIVSSISASALIAVFFLLKKRKEQR